MPNRVGILTFQRSYNYGATLQAYALMRALRCQGAEAQVIDYQPEAMSCDAMLIRPSESFSLSTMAKAVARLIKHQAFDSFSKKELHLTAPVRTQQDLADLARGFDAMVVGSDQVWNDKITSCDEAFYLDVPGYMGARYSYAASFGGDSSIARQVARDHAQNIQRLDVVSLREQEGLDLFKGISKSQVRIDLDPTLLLDQAEWLSVASPRIVREPYLFLYTVAPGEYLATFAREYANTHGLRVIDAKSNPDFLAHCSPADFVSWVNNADAVVTSSFHGAAFSILFHKNMFVELRRGKLRNQRAAGLMEVLGLLDREITSDLAPAGCASIDWDYVEKRLTSLRASSLRYIKQIVESPVPRPPIEPGQVFVGTHRDKRVHQQSSSGGAFSALANAFLEGNPDGTVYGAATEGATIVRHVRVCKVEELSILRGSKYVPSDARAAYQQVASDLRAGVAVLFSGTPCQCAALKCYLSATSVSKEKLVLVSFVCHGVASPRFFRDYIARIEHNVGAEATGTKFRAKSAPGKLQDMQVQFDSGFTYTAASTLTDWFYSVYQSNLVLRESCYQCPFAGGDRPSDIDLADAWAVPDATGLGLSCVYVNSPKGAALLARASGLLRLQEVDREKVIQPQLKGPVDKPGQYDGFWQAYEEGGYMAAQRTYGNATPKGRARAMIVRMADASGMRSIRRGLRG